MMSSNDKIVLQTPIARTRYSHLSKPDTKWNSEGEYKTELVLDKATDETKAFVKSIEDAARSYYGPDAAKAQLPLKTDAETGELIFKAKSSFKPKFVDSDGVLLREANIPNIFSGSEIRMFVTLKPTSAQGKIYVSSYIQAVQLIKVVESTVTDSLGFDPVEDGFKARPDLGGSNDLQPGDAGARDLASSFLD